MLDCPGQGCSAPLPPVLSWFQTSQRWHLQAVTCQPGSNVAAAFSTFGFEYERAARPSAPSETLAVWCRATRRSTAHFHILFAADLVFALSSFLLPFIFPLFNQVKKKNKTKKKPCFNYRSADLSPVRRGDKHREIRTKYRQTQKYKRDVKSLNPPWKTGVSEDTVWRFSVLLIIAGKGSFCLSVEELWRAQKPVRILFLYWCQRQGRTSKKCKRSSRVTLSLNPKSTKDTNTDPSYT